MNKTVIYKYAAAPGPFRLSLPVGARFLSVQTQRNEPQMWFLIRPGAEIEERRFLIVGTGHEIDGNPGQYLGTFQLNGGALVFHLFEVNS